MTKRTNPESTLEKKNEQQLQGQKKKNAWKIGAIEEKMPYGYPGSEEGQKTETS